MADQSVAHEPEIPTNTNPRFSHQEVIILGCRAVMEYAGRDAQPGDAAGLFQVLHDSPLGYESALCALGELVYWMTEAELIAVLDAWLRKARERAVIAAHVKPCPQCGHDCHDWPTIERELATLRKPS